MQEHVALIGSGSPLLALGLALVRKDAELLGIWSKQRARAQISTLALGCPAFAQSKDALKEASIALSDLPYEELRSFISGSAMVAAVIASAPQYRVFLENEAEITPMSDTLPCCNHSCQTSGRMSDKQVYEDIFSDGPGGDWENSGRMALRLILDGVAPERVWGALRLRGDLSAVEKLSRFFAEYGFDVKSDI